MGEGESLVSGVAARKAASDLIVRRMSLTANTIEDIEGDVEITTPNTEDEKAESDDCKQSDIQSHLSKSDVISDEICANTVVYSEIDFK